MKRKTNADLEEEVANKKVGVKVAAKDEREKFHKSLYRPPTSEEINELKETETLYKDSLFRMQMTCLLDEVKLKENEQSELDKVLHSLHSFLNEIENWTESKELSDKSWLPHLVTFPINFSKERPMKGSFQFKKPSSIKVVGSFLLKTGASPTPSVDVAVEMPADSFHKKDFLNYRYHIKRALYLSVLAVKLLSWEAAISVHFVRPRRNMKKPALLVECKGSSGKLYHLYILPTISKETFNLSRFLPHQNNVRASWLHGNSDTEEETGAPTPFYNASILEDALYEDHLHYLYETTKSCPGMVDAIILIKVWLQQRGFYEDCCAFNGFVASMLMAYLLACKQITSHMSSYQIFRVTLRFLATSKWVETGVSMVMGKTKAKIPSHSEIKASFDVAFVDPTGRLNLCAGLTVVDYEHLVYEASKAVEILDAKHVDSFDALFVRRLAFVEKFDHWFRLPNVTKAVDGKDRLIDRAVESDEEDWPSDLVKRIIAVLTKGVKSRLKCLYPKPMGANKWSVSEPPRESAMNDVLFGMILNPADYDRIIEKGPAADAPEAAEFSSFWGDKAELRRFKDGNISKAVVWQVKSLADRMMVTRQVVLHLLKKHFEISEQSVSYCSNQLNALLQPRIREDMAAKVAVNGTNFEEQQKVCEVFEALSKDLRKLTDLPLQINAVQGLSPVLRLTEVFAPRMRIKSKKATKTRKTQFGSYELPDASGKLGLWTPVIEVSVQFEVSGKWPNDIAAVQHLKTAFYIKFAELTKKQYGLQCLVSPTYLDLFKGGYVFRLRIFHFRELALLKELDAPGAEKKEVLQRMRELDRTMVKLPLHSTMIHGIVLQFPAFRDTVRLAKRWVSSQLLSDYLSDTAVELIASSLFLSPAPYEPPVCFQSGFLRFLQKLTAFDWKNSPLIIDLNFTLKEEDYEEITEHFQHNRPSLPSLFIATPYDKTDSVWTTHQPDNMILRRIIFLAKEALIELQQQLLPVDCSSLKDAFRPNFGDFDVVIMLDRERLPRHFQAVDSGFLVRPPSLHGAACDVMPAADFDPALFYLRDLKTSFSEFAQFFYDPYGGLAIGVLWKAKQFEPEPLKILHCHYRMLVRQLNNGSAQHTVPDVAAILADFVSLGQGLVKEVKVLRCLDS